MRGWFVGYDWASETAKCFGGEIDDEDSGSIRRYQEGCFVSFEFKIKGGRTVIHFRL